MTDYTTCLDGIIHVVESISYESMPDDVKSKAKELLADYFGIFINGKQKKDSQLLRQAVGDENISNPEDLALWMGSTARMLDIDDGHRFAMAHPGVVIHSTALALAVMNSNLRGSKLLEAIARGYEIYCYQGRVINPSAYLKRGFDATSVCGAAAAAVVAGTLMDFNSVQLRDAASLAASITGGLNQSAIDGSAQKFLVAGWGAKVGIVAANLAKYGLGGPSRVFEGKLGFCNGFSPEPDLNYLNNPKLVWDIKNVYVKMYACVRRIHTTLDAIFEIITEKKIKAEEILKVDVFGSQFLYDAGAHNPKDEAQAQTSVPYVVALLLKYGRVVDELVHSHINDQEIAEYSQKINVFKDPEIIALAEKDKSLWGAARVEVHTTDGRLFENKKITPNGDPETPLPEGAVQRKFSNHVSEVYDESFANDLWRQLMDIDTDDIVHNLTEVIFSKE